MSGASANIRPRRISRGRLAFIRMRQRDDTIPFAIRPMKRAAFAALSKSDKRRRQICRNLLPFDMNICRHLPPFKAAGWKPLTNSTMLNAFQAPDSTPFNAREPCANAHSAPSGARNGLGSTWITPVIVWLRCACQWCYGSPRTASLASSVPHVTMLARQEGRRLRIHAASVAAGWLMKRWNICARNGNNRRSRQPTGECAAMRQHRHAARHGGQSAYKARPRLPIARRPSKIRTRFRRNQQRHSSS